MLNAERLRDLLDYNPKTGVFVWRVSLRGRFARIGSVAGRQDGHGYTRIGVDRQEYAAARLAWLFVYGQWPRCEIDHINHIKTDNRIANLREATRSNNIHNRRLTKRNTTGFKGIKRVPSGWLARITHKGKFRHLGTYRTPEAAAEAYRRASQELHGEFSCA
jgi:hypothetical protein